MYKSIELLIKTCLAELSWLVNGMKFEISCINKGKTETGYKIPEKIETNKLIRKLTGSACLKYKTKDRARNDNAIKGISIIKKSKTEKTTEISKNSWLPIS
jgi:hypothetical protein